MDYVDEKLAVLQEPNFKLAEEKANELLDALAQRLKGIGITVHEERGQNGFAVPNGPIVLIGASHRGLWMRVTARPTPS